MAVLIGAAIIVIVTTLLRICLAPEGDWGNVVRKVVVFRFDAIGYGVLLAYASMYRTDLMDRLKTPVSATIGALCIMALYINLGHEAQGPRGPAIWRNGLWFSAASISLVPLIAYASTVVSSKVSLIRTLAPIVSTYSYSLYLWHLIVLTAVDKYRLTYHGPLRLPTELCLFTIGTCLLSWIAYHLVEKPFMDLRNQKPIGHA
jgi:peptidoglycan/LPS O-acetylase OafA/YrhL